MSRYRFASAERVEEVLDRMATRMAALQSGSTTLLGLRRRGAPLARRLATRLEEVHAVDVRLGELELERYSDELEILHDEPKLTEPDEVPELGGRDVFLVDDVLYTGRTLFKALDYCMDAGAARVRCAVLCSRGEHEVPIHVDVVGLRCDVAPGEVVDVSIPPFEEETAVVLREREADEG